MTKPKDDLLRPRDDEFLKNWAMDYYKDKIFTDRMIRNCDASLVGTVFMILIFLGEDDRAVLKDAQEKGTYGLTFEYYDKAGPRGVNGYPIFTSCAFLCKGDVEKVNQYLQRIDAAMKTI